MGLSDSCVALLTPGGQGPAEKTDMCDVFVIRLLKPYGVTSATLFTEAVTKVCPCSRSGGSGEVLQEHVQREVLLHLFGKCSVPEVRPVQGQVMVGDLGR